MSSDTTWTSPSRILLVIAIGLLVVGAWIAGRMSAGGGAAGMMGERMMNESMHHRTSGGHGRSGSRSATDGQDVDFSGDAGLQRCRAVMGTVMGGHRSMQSMMGVADSTDQSGRHGSPVERHADSRHRHMMNGDVMDGDVMDGDVMDGDVMDDDAMDGDAMDTDKGYGSMHESMHGRMGGAMDAMSTEQMRSLCRTMQSAMHAAMTSDSAAPTDRRTESAAEESKFSDETRQWLRGTRGFETVRDRTGENEVVVEVGAGDGFRYAPAAVRVDPGTTVRWRWTGRGGLHDVAFRNTNVSTSLREEAGSEFTATFDEPGEYRYECTPHTGLGMRGAVIVSRDA